MTTFVEVEKHGIPVVIADVATLYHCRGVGDISDVTEKIVPSFLWAEPTHNLLAVKIIGTAMSFPMEVAETGSVRSDTLKCMAIVIDALCNVVGVIALGTIVKFFLQSLPKPCVRNEALNESVKIVDAFGVFPAS